MEGLATLEQREGTDALIVPESRIGSASNARAIVDGLIRSEDTRAQRRTKQQGLLDGNPPVPPGVLKAKGRGEEPNINLREAEGALDAAKTPYYGLIFDPERFAQVQFRYGNDPMKNAEWSRIITEEFHDMIESWDGFDFNIQLHQWEMCYYGVGPIYWQDSRDWRFEALKIGKLLVPDRSKADIDKLEVCAIPHSYLAHEIWRFIKNEGTAKTAGWNVEAVKRAIAGAATTSGTSTTTGTGSWEHYQTSLRNGDLYWGLSQSKTIDVVHLLSREFSGKITHHILLQDGTASSKASTLDAATKEEFLYEKKERFESFANVICPFFFDIGTGDWHSIKGLGPKIFDFCSLSNLLTMRLIGGAMMGSGIILKATNANALQQTSIVSIGGGASVISQDYDVQQVRLAENLQGPLTVKQDLRNTLQSNTGQYTGRANEKTPYPTLGQEQMNATHIATLGQGAVNRYCKIGDRMYREMLRRALAASKSDPGGEQAVEFRERCIERGVPEEALKFENVCKVKMTRSIGNGSAQIRQMTAAELVSMLPTMSEPARNTALRIWAASRPGGGQQLADQLYPVLSDADIPDDQDWAASMENSVLREMNDAIPVVTSKQDHVTHFQSHFQDVAMHAQQLQSGQGNPMELMVHLEKTGPHTREHLLKIEMDPTRESQIEMLTKAWLGMSKMADQLRQQIEEAQAAAEAQQPEQAPDPKLISALTKVHGELGIRREKMLGDQQLKAEKQAASLRLKDLLAAHKIRSEREQAAARRPALRAA